MSDSLILEDKLGPTNLGKDYGLSNLVEGGVYAALAVGLGLTATGAAHDFGYIVNSNFGAAATGALLSPIVPFFGFAAGVGHALGEPGSKEKILTGATLVGTLAYSFKTTLDSAYSGMSITSYLLESIGGNYWIGAAVAYQALLPVLFVFGGGYAVGKLIRWITGRSKRVTKREREK